MHYYIFEDSLAMDFYPLTVTRAAFELRYGAFTFIERIQKLLKTDRISVIARDELAPILQERYPHSEINPLKVREGVWLLGNVLWTKLAIKNICDNAPAIYQQDGRIIAAKLSEKNSRNWVDNGGPITGDTDFGLPSLNLELPVMRYLWDLIESTEIALEDDAQFFDLGNHALAVANGIVLVNADRIYIATPELVKPQVCIDATDGPVIIDEGVAVGAGAIIMGPVYIGKDARISANAIIRSGSIIGPACNVGGEVVKSIFQGYTNKSHGGFMGNSYLGEWVNIGAGTNCSNLKNNYRPIKVQINEKVIETGLTHVGVFMGDHCKTGIGLKINGGLTFGLACSIVSNELLQGDIPSFSFIYNDIKSKYLINKFLETAEIVMNRRQILLTDALRILYETIYIG